MWILLIFHLLNSNQYVPKINTVTFNKSFHEEKFCQYNLDKHEELG